MEFLTKLLGIATAVAETTTTTGAADPAAVTTDSAAGGIVGILFSLLPLLLVFVLMYFMMIRPEKKRRKKEQDMLASLKKGDRVCTIGGIYATIESIRDDHHPERRQGRPDDGCCALGDSLGGRCDHRERDRILELIAKFPASCRVFLCPIFPPRICWE